MQEEKFKDFKGPGEASVDRLIIALEKVYHNPWHMMWRSFLHGLTAGVGATIGTALVVSLSVYVFQAVDGVKFLQPTINRLQEMILQPASRLNSADAQLDSSTLPNE